MMDKPDSGFELERKPQGLNGANTARISCSVDVIERFVDAMWMERGLSENTLAAYRSDLNGLAHWLGERGMELTATTRDQLKAFIEWRNERGAQPRSMARQLSSIRRFFHYLLRERIVEQDPSLRIDMPKLGRPLPKSMPEAEVERLLAAPDTEESLGLRDRAMLEVLYATGLRVSELVSLRV
jgi:integrase/recombinase XerD